MSIALPTSSSSLFLIEVLIYVARQQVVFKMDRHGNGDELLLDNVFESRNCTPSFRNFNQELFIGEISKTPKTSFSFCFLWWSLPCFFFTVIWITFPHFMRKTIVSSFYWDTELATDLCRNFITGMCVLAGCDFLPSVPGIGIAKAYSMVSKYRNLDRVRVSKPVIIKLWTFPEKF